MIIRSARIDRYVFDAFIHSSRSAKEWINEAKSRAAWFDIELFADFFLCFYLEKPEIDPAREAAPFHRWLIGTLKKQYFYRTIHPRTISRVNASFKTALKALMWLTATYEKEVEQRKKEEQRLLALGLKEEQGNEGEEAAKVSEQFTDRQVKQLKLVGYTLQQGKKTAEEKQAAKDSRPLVESEISALREQMTSLQEEMRTQFTKRTKLKQKAKKLEEELSQREKQLRRLMRQEKEAIASLEAELGQWLNTSLKETLAVEDEENEFLQDLLEASQRFASRRWGSELGKLRRQTFEQYIHWAEKLRNHPQLLAFLQEVGRNVHQFRVKRRKMKSPHIPEAYDDLRQSGDISHMLPGEAVLLADEDFELYFTVKWLEQKLMTYNTTGFIEEPQKGPVVCMLDTSHSMRGSKLRLAQIFVMTFAALSLLERRDFVLLLFGAKGELKEQFLYHNKPDWQAFYELSQMAFGGGTHFDAPMKRALEIIEQTKAFRHADLVMVTDGIGQITPPVQDMLFQLGRKKQLRLHSLIVGSARQHLVQKYDILGVSHQVRFAATWETQGEAANELLLDVFKQQPKKRPL
ncbi:VWA domain-containing protein [Aneurinibacillus tyrosinisolvens]|uniref:VWA domain-containing protein n=1 Tax=Aneurinibacillus tyrosinisolvens TaxID=1443435 RepID=UPI00063EFE3D|nr:VWA domain-containing protein [Aneurinibacillus tyrosinisolvens]